MDQLETLKELIKPVIQEKELSLYDLSWRDEGSSKILTIAIMRSDGTMDIDECAQMSELISQVLDEKDMIAFEYYLEVCSPGAERVLRNEEEIKEAVNEYVYVKLKNCVKNLDEVKGTLLKCENGVIEIQYMNKAVKAKMETPIENITLIRLSVKI
ncbi:MAG: ribosome maturation factor RimP [Erysipelotrichaceae bacterium]